MWVCVRVRLRASWRQYWRRCMTGDYGLVAGRGGVSTRAAAIIDARGTRRVVVRQRLDRQEILMCAKNSVHTITPMVG